MEKRRNMGAALSPNWGKRQGIHEVNKYSWETTPWAYFEKNEISNNTNRGCQVILLHRWEVGGSSLGVKGQDDVTAYNIPVVMMSHTVMLWVVGKLYDTIGLKPQNFAPDRGHYCMMYLVCWHHFCVTSSCWGCHPWRCCCGLPPASQWWARTPQIRGSSAATWGMVTLMQNSRQQETKQTCIHTHISISVCMCLSFI